MSIDVPGTATGREVRLYIDSAHEIKTGDIEVEYSRSYERVMDDRHVSDYDVEAVIESGRAIADVEDARQFVQRVERLLTEEGWL